MKLKRTNRLSLFTFGTLVVLSLGVYQNCSNANFSAAPANTSANPSGSPCDPTTASYTLSGHVVDATNKAPISGVAVTVKTTSGGTILKSGTTDASGNYSITGLTAGTFDVSLANNGYITLDNNMTSSSSCSTVPVTTTALSPTLLAGQMRIVLTWTGAPPNWANIQTTYRDTVMDMDSYLLVPGFTDPIYWKNCDHSPSAGVTSSCNVTGAYLDVDQIDWSGPETITITQPTAGTYTYYLANYSDPCNPLGLTSSSAIVTVYSGSQVVKRYTINPGAPPTGKSGQVFEVFTINNGQLTDVNQYNDSLPTALVNPQASDYCNQYLNQ